MSNEEVVLLDAYFSMFGMRVRVSLAEKGVEYEYKEQNLIDKSPALIEANPVHKKIPVLIHNGKPICESMIIVEYIDEVWKGEFPLLPSDPYKRAQARFWVDFVDKNVVDGARKLWTTKGEEQEAAKKDLVEILKLVEAELGDKTYFGGDNFGFVDVALITLYNWLEAYKTYANFSVEEHCPELMEWAKRCLLKESVSKSLSDPKKFFEFAFAMKKGCGKQQ